MAGHGRAARRHTLLGAGVAAVVVAADQVTKTWALHLPPQGRHVAGTLWFELTFNHGAAFGLGSGVTPIVEGLVVVLLLGLVVFGRRSTLRSGPWAAVGLGLVVGGAVGNLSDRVFRHHGGAVIDFVNAAQFGDHEYWPVFNVADSCIVVGALILAWRYSRSQSRRRRPVGHTAGDTRA